MAGIWQILLTIFTTEAVPGEPMVPGWQIVFSRSLLESSCLANDPPSRGHRVRHESPELIQ